MKPSIWLSASLLLPALGLLSGCDDAPLNEAQKMLPKVTVAHVVQEQISDWKEFSGRLEAPQTVALRPRVSGYIDSVNFAEGEYVEAGTPLFFIDDREFRAEVNRLRASLDEAISATQLAKSEYDRAKRLAAQSAIAKETLENRQAQLQQAQAGERGVRAALELATLQRGYTRVVAPISGRVSRAQVTPGNYVSAGNTTLTSIVSTDKVYAYFDADEQSYLAYLRNVRNEDGQNTPVLMALANEETFAHKGEVDFLDNQINPTTGTIRARAVFANTDNTFVPGLFARIRLSGSDSYQGVLIDDKAIGTDLSNKFVLVLNDQGVVDYRPVTLGQKMAGLRVITSGLQGNETIVVNGMQRVRPGTEVDADKVAMASDEALAKLAAMQQLMESNVAPELASNQPMKAISGGR